MNTYRSNTTEKNNAIIFAKKHIRKQNEIYKFSAIGAFLLTAFVFLLNAGKGNNIGEYLLGSFLQGVAPLVIGLILLFHYLKNIKRPYWETKNETVTLYNDYMEYSHEIDDTKTTYRIPYKEIGSFFVIEGYEFVILARKVRVTQVNTVTSVKTVDDDKMLRRIEILYVFDNKEEMLNMIREQVAYHAETDEN